MLPGPSGPDSAGNTPSPPPDELSARIEHHRQQYQLWVHLGMPVGQQPWMTPVRCCGECLGPHKFADVKVSGYIPAANQGGGARCRSCRAPMLPMEPLSLVTYVVPKAVEIEWPEALTRRGARVIPFNRLAAAMQEKEQLQDALDQS